jgi:hypothetical protein
MPSTSTAKHPTCPYTITFTEANHRYVDNEGRDYISGTSIVNSLFEPFDAPAVAERVAERDGTTALEVLAQWKAKGKAASEYGTRVHEYAEALILGKTPPKPTNTKQVCAFAVVDKAMKRAFRFWKTALCFNTDLDADYPEFTAPFWHSRGIAQKLPASWWNPKQTENPNAGNATGAQLAVGEGLIVLPDNRGCIGGATINGNVRGLNHAAQDGKLLRPTIALLDDVQDRKVAKSPVQVQEIVDMIDGQSREAETEPMVNQAYQTRKNTKWNTMRT